MWKSWGMLESSDGADAAVPLVDQESSPAAAAMVGVGEPEAVAASEVFGAGAEWLKWTLPEEESVVKSWTESIIDVEQENDQVRLTLLIHSSV